MKKRETVQKNNLSPVNAIELLQRVAYKPGIIVNINYSHDYVDEVENEKRRLNTLLTKATATLKNYEELITTCKKTIIIQNETIDSCKNKLAKL